MFRTQIKPHVFVCAKKNVLIQPLRALSLNASPKHDKNTSPILEQKTRYRKMQRGQSFFPGTQKAAGSQVGVLVGGESMEEMKDYRHLAGLGCGSLIR